MVSPRAATRVREVRATRDLILDAAEARFAERGFAGVSMRGIAADAGLKNQASLYHHFRNKRALYQAVLERGVEAILGLLTGRASKPARVEARAVLAPAAIDAFLDRILDYLAEHPHLPRLIQRAGLDGDRRLHATATKLLRPLYATGLAALRGRGPWESTDLPHLAAGIYHVVFGYFANGPLLASVFEEDLLRPGAVARQRRFVKAAVAGLLDLRRARGLTLTRRITP
jgi:TetR/AcrR family transcriptional regulator